MPGVRAVLFDFGGVLWDMRWDAARHLEDEHGLPRGSVFETLYRTAAWEDVERGRGDRDAWRARAHQALESSAGHELPPLHELWRAAQRVIPATVALVRALRSRYRLGILSNADLSLRERLADGLGLAPLFDDIVCSAEVGCAKPEAEIYRLAASRLGVQPDECAFIDDHAPNVEAARALGMRGVHFRVDRGDDLAVLLARAGVAVPERPED